MANVDSLLRLDERRTRLMQEAGDLAETIYVVFVNLLSEEEQQAYLDQGGSY